MTPKCDPYSWKFNSDQLLCEYKKWYTKQLIVVDKSLLAMYIYLVLVNTELVKNSNAERASDSGRARKFARARVQ